MIYPSNSSPKRPPYPVMPTTTKTFFCAVIILGLLGLAIAGAGGASYSGQLGTWSGGALSVDLMNAYLMMGVGGIGGLLLISTGIVGSVKDTMRRMREEIEHGRERVEIEKANTVSVEADLINANRRADTAETQNREQGNQIRELKSQKKGFLNKIGKLEADRAQLEAKCQAQQTRAEEAEQRLGILREQQSLVTGGYVDKVWKVYDYEEVAAFKYQVVLEEYRRLLDSLDNDLTQVDQAINSNPNDMLTHLKEALLRLRYPLRFGARTAYQEFVMNLRKCIISQEYDTPENHFRPLIHKICIIRWGETNLHSYLDGNIQLKIGKQPQLSAENFPEKLLEQNRAIDSTQRFRKSDTALSRQRASGACGFEDFCGNHNTPHVRHRLVLENEAKTQHRQLTSIRHGSPTAPTNMLQQAGALTGIVSSTECVTPDYEEYLRALAEEGKSELLVVHQRRFKKGEDETTRAKALEDLQKRHDNCYVLVQYVEDLLEPHASCTSLQGLQQILENEFCDPDLEDPARRVSLPVVLQRNPNEYRPVFKQLMKDVQEIFFPEGEAAFGAQNPLLEENRQCYIFLVYAFQRMDLRCRLNVTYFKGPCKDFLDRGGAQALVDEMLFLYMLREENNPTRLDEVRVNTLGPPILIKKIGVIEHRLTPGLSVLRRLQRMGEEERERLSSYRFAGWKVVGMEVPKPKQSATLPIFETIKKRLDAIATDQDETARMDQILAVFQRLAEIDLDDWHLIASGKVPAGTESGGMLLRDLLLTHEDLLRLQRNGDPKPDPLYPEHIVAQYDLLSRKGNEPLVRFETRTGERGVNWVVTDVGGSSRSSSPGVVEGTSSS